MNSARIAAHRSPLHNEDNGLRRLYRLEDQHTAKWPRRPTMPVSSRSSQNTYA